jgi:hypothetical protein
MQKLLHIRVQGAECTERAPGVEAVVLSPQSTWHGGEERSHIPGHQRRQWKRRSKGRDPINFRSGSRASSWNGYGRHA